jgi:hypothetical protein
MVMAVAVITLVRVAATAPAIPPAAVATGRAVLELLVLLSDIG